MIADNLINLPRVARRSILLALDLVCVLVAVWAAFAMRFSDWWPPLLDRSLWLFPLAVVVSLPVFVSLGFYRSILRYTGADSLYTIVQGASISLLILIAIWVFSGGPEIPRSAWFNYGLVVTVLLGGNRLLLRDYLRNRFANASCAERVVIYGAGSAGVQLAMALKHSREYLPTAFVDDNPDLHGSRILGVKVYPPARLAQMVARRRITTLLLAIPSASRSRRCQILESLESLPVHVMVMPGVAELASGVKRVDDLREVEVGDTLGREVVQPNEELLRVCIDGKTVMVTGAGGSIGSELCRQIVRLVPRRLVLLEHSEFGLYSIEQELRAALIDAGRTLDLIPILGSVCDHDRVRSVMEAFRVQTVYHAAAYKHVPIVEYNPLEGIRNNTLGTLYTAQAALDSGVEHFVLISTDKAVRPTNIMGATKRLAEMALQALAEQSRDRRTRLCMVRFGNVLDSSGSVVPLFREQIRRGGPVTVTDPEVVRYFMTITEAAQLAIQAGSLGRDGEVFVLNMGDPVKILDLARRMIRLSGLEVRDDEHPDGDIEIVFTGLRPGEKLYEELLIGESDAPTIHPMITQAQEEYLPWATLQTHLEVLGKALERQDCREARQVLLRLVAGYRPADDIQDRVWLEQAALWSPATQEVAAATPAPGPISPSSIAPFVRRR